MSFHLGAKSEAELVGVDAGIVNCVRLAITFTEQDFGVYEGLRKLERQVKLVAAGASRTLDSYHIADDRGIGHALDLLPFIEGRLQWQDPLGIKIARAMHKADAQLRTCLTWGGVWDRQLGWLDPDDLEGSIEAYVARYRKTHPPVLVNGKLKPRHPLIDIPHFQGLRDRAKVITA